MNRNWITRPTIKFVTLKLFKLVHFNLYTLFFGILLCKCHCFGNTTLSLNQKLVILLFKTFVDMIYLRKAELLKFKQEIANINYFRSEDSQQFGLVNTIRWNSYDNFASNRKLKPTANWKLNSKSTFPCF